MRLVVLWYETRTNQVRRNQGKEPLAMVSGGVSESRTAGSLQP